MGACAFDEGWRRRFAPADGIKGWDRIALVGLSLKARLSGGSCVVLRDVVATLEPGGQAESPTDAAYAKMRLAFVTFPPEASTIVPTLLAGTPRLKEAIERFMADFRDIVRERDDFWAACGTDPADTAKRAGIDFRIDLGATGKTT